MNLTEKKQKAMNKTANLMSKPIAGSCIKITANKEMTINESLKIPTFGPHKIVFFENKLIFADTLLACSPIAMLSIILVPFIFG